MADDQRAWLLIDVPYGRMLRAGWPTRGREYPRSLLEASASVVSARVLFRGRRPDRLDRNDDRAQMGKKPHKRCR